jgi:pheromone shutdown-related protein TraB
MQYKNLILLGTSHIAKQSLDEVENTINSLKPDIVCIELDKKRLYALTNKDKKRKINLKDIRKVGIKGFLFSLIGAYVEKKLGQHVGVEPGSEMLKAVELAKKNQIKLMVIDQDIEITLKRFSQEFTWKEKGRIVADIFKAIIFRKKEIDFDLRTVPKKETIKKLLNKVKSRYPNLYRVLITERNEYMASKLAKIIKVNENKKILAIIGAGHEEEMVNLIKNKKVDVIGHSYTYTIE